MSGGVDVLEVAKVASLGTPGPWALVGSLRSHGIGGAVDQPGSFPLVCGGISGDDARAAIAAVNYIRDHGEALDWLIKAARSVVATGDESTQRMAINGLREALDFLEAEQ